MTELVAIALCGFVAVVVALFTLLPPRRAALVSFIAGWLFLPQAGLGLEGVPDLTKTTATSFSVLLAIILFDAGTLLRLKPHWIDIPVVVLCVSPIPSSLANDLGLYDGLSLAVEQCARWGVPWLVGRLYFRDLRAVRELAIALVIGALVYVPLCLIEMRFSPQLHRWVYGFHQHAFVQTQRWGGYRPMVFMQHGLAVAMWMTSATLVAAWLAASGSLRHLSRVPAWAIVGALVVTTVLCRSSGALLLLGLGFAVLAATRTTRSALPLICVIAIAPTWLWLRAGAGWNGDALVEMAAKVSEERAISLEGRFRDEAAILARVRAKPAFGWGTWGRWRIDQEIATNKEGTKADSLWIITLGQHGWTGLVSLCAVLLLPPLLLARRVPPRAWLSAAGAAPAALAVLLVLHMIDGLLNAMGNPVYVLAAGALGAIAAAPRVAHAAQIFGTPMRVVRRAGTAGAMR